jgi:two-component system, OmpR family, phosphate regulon response regulator PhoB
MKKILAVEDDPDILRLLQYHLERDGFSFVGLTSGDTAVACCLQERPDLILLDVMLPGMTGIDICRMLRASSECATTPILFLTARSQEEDRVLGLELGANDYIVKPFFVRELLVRVRSQLRPRVRNRQLLACGDLELDPMACRVRMAGNEVEITSTEFKLLEFFLSNPGRVYSRQQILEAVWGHGRAVTERTVDVYILRLRQKVDPRSELFHSVRSFGYSLNRPAVAAVAALA